MNSSNTDLRQVDFMNKISLKINYIMKIIATILFLFLTSDYICGQVVIGPGTADPSAQLDIKSTNRGLLPPRMKQVERDDIISPPAGLLIWCTDCGNGKIPDAVSFDNNAIRNVESAGQMQVFNGKTWTDIYGKSPLTAEPDLSFQKALFPNQSAKILQPCDFKVSLKYQGGNGVTFNTNGTFYSTDQPGLVAVLETTSGTLSRDSGEIVLRVTGMPYKYGDANFVINFFQNSFSFKVPISSGNLSFRQVVPIQLAVFDPSKGFSNLTDYFTSERSRSTNTNYPLYRVPTPYIIHLLTPGQEGYDPNIQHGYLLIYGINFYTPYLTKNFDFNGLQFSTASYSELINLYDAKTTNGFSGFILSASSPKSDQTKYYYLNFTDKRVPLSRAKNYISDSHVSWETNQYSTFLIYRF